MGEQPEDPAGAGKMQTPTITEFNALNERFQVEARLGGIFVVAGAAVYAQAPTMKEALAQALATCKRLGESPPVVAPRKRVAREPRPNHITQKQGREFEAMGRDYVADFFGDEGAMENLESAAYDIAHGQARGILAECIADRIFEGMHKERAKRAAAGKKAVQS